MKRIFFLTILVIFTVISFAQNYEFEEPVKPVEPVKPEYRPDWMYSIPMAGNNSYLYVVEHGEGSTECEALNHAIARVIQTTANRTGQPISTDVIHQAAQAGVDYEVIGKTMNIPFNKVCEFPIKKEDNTWTIYVLFQVAVAGNITPYFDVYNCSANTIFNKNMENYESQLKEYQQKMLAYQTSLKNYKLEIARRDSLEQARIDSLEQVRIQMIEQARLDSLEQVRLQAIEQAKKDSVLLVRQKEQMLLQEVENMLNF